MPALTAARCFRLTAALFVAALLARVIPWTARESRSALAVGLCVYACWWAWQGMQARRAERRLGHG
ncbi:MAG: hypothetical protein QM704_04365 [Anaeromyxobacteraceae bacterium]